MDPGAKLGQVFVPHRYLKSGTTSGEGQAVLLCLFLIGILKAVASRFEIEDRYGVCSS